MNPPNPFQDKAEEIVKGAMSLDKITESMLGSHREIVWRPEAEMVELVTSALLSSHQEGIKEGAERVLKAVEDVMLKAQSCCDNQVCHAPAAHTVCVEAARKAYEHETETY